MIPATQADSVSPYVRHRAAKMKVRVLSPFCYMVTPGEKGKAKRIVNFVYSPDNDKVFIDCCDAETGESCPANMYRLHCAHAESAIRRLLANAKRTGKISAQDAKRNRKVQSYARQVVRERLPGVQP